MESTKVMGRRVLAYIIDGILLSAVNVGVFFAMAEKDTDVVQKLTSGEYSPTDTTYGNITIGDHEWAIVGGKFWLYLAIGLAVFVLYDWVLQGLKGWTIGKLITGIRTVKEDGTAPGIGKAVVRWFLWVADGFPYIIFGLLGFIVALTNDQRQRIGDKVAGTYVIEARAMGQPVVAVAPPPPTAA
jgi:uncharacterized RDD family membrane protein YckC